MNKSITTAHFTHLLLAIALFVLLSAVSAGGGGLRHRDRHRELSDGICESRGQKMMKYNIEMEGHEHDAEWVEVSLQKFNPQSQTLAGKWNDPKRLQKHMARKSCLDHDECYKVNISINTGIAAAPPAKQWATEYNKLQVKIEYDGKWYKPGDAFGNMCRR
jgi:hypothetical protein